LHGSRPHVAQIVGYLKAARLRDGLLINFGESTLVIPKYRNGAGSTQVAESVL
jgi:hypothetical protein